MSLPLVIPEDASGLVWESVHGDADGHRSAFLGDRLARAALPTMALVRYRREIQVATPADVTFAYLSDFSNTSEWDPGIVEARRLTPAPTAVGSRFEVTALFRGRPQRFEYVVTELDDGLRIALRGEGEKAVSDDVIVVAAAGDGGTRVVYEADLRLKGVYRVAEPILAATFERMGDAALDGLAARLSETSG